MLASPRLPAHSIAFYEEYHRHEKIIEIYSVLLEKYRKATRRLLTSSPSRCCTRWLATAGCSDGVTPTNYHIETRHGTQQGQKAAMRTLFEASVALLTYYYEEKELDRAATDLCCPMGDVHSSHQNVHLYLKRLFSSCTNGNIARA